MAGPWERYAAEQAPAADGPWSKFAAQGPRVSTGEAIAMGAGDIPQGARQILANVVPQSFVNAVSNPIMERLNRVPILGPMLAAQGIQPTENAAQTVNQMVTEREADYQGRRAAAGQTGIDWGRIGGNVAASLPLAVAAPAPASLGGAVAAGAGMGAVGSALQPVPGATEESFGGEKAAQAAMGAVTGGAFAPVGYAAGRMIAPRVDPNVARLRAEGVDLTPGQAAGGATRRVEDALASVPYLGDVVRNAQEASLRSFNRAAANRVLQPLGEKIDDTVAPGHSLIGAVQDKIAQAYQRIHPNLRVDADAQFATDVQKVANQFLTPTNRAAFEKAVADNIMSRLGNGPVDGATYQVIKSDLGRLASEYSGSATVAERELGRAFGSLRNAFQDLAARTNPQWAPELRKADAAYAAFTRIQDAAGRAGAKEGVFTPTTLNQAVRQGDRTLRKGDYARGDAVLQDFSDAARAVLPSTVPDSGTPFRGMVGALAAGAIPAQMVSPYAAIPAGAMYGAYSEPGRRLLAALLAGQRPQAVQTFGEGLARGGVAAAPLAGALLAQPSP